MSGHLAIHDVSGWVYTGMRVEKYSNFTVQGFPMGGVQYFLKYLVLNIVNMHDIAVMFDGGSSFRKQLYPDYKKGRTGDHAVDAQLEFLYENLLKCNIPSYKVREFEGDDLIFSAVEKFRPEYNAISIYSTDYDTCHNVDEIVRFEAINSNVNNITWRNFNSSVVRGEEIMLNTLSAHKVFHGCTSDKIAPFKSALDNTTLYKLFCEFLVQNLKQYSIAVSRNKAAFTDFFLPTLAGKLTPAEMDELKVRADIIYPKLCDSVDFKTGNKQSIDLDAFARLLSYCNDSAGLKSINKHRNSLNDLEIEMFRKMARELRTGEFAVDRNRPVSVIDTEVELLSLREF